ncbi:hypothetical protein, variant [Phytophthora nicotianae P1569]|uniref:Uncharacterized protein n=1 Tax=Phytophthora nicotianae P1569 TaxID=1317065 RepID=V9G1X1_PHYNI|nr:hypothetical protein F443_00612 [Phytophthora nicotianae P1569]ETI57034.1 hypothetical protein, variant [Phytophthora nicotianae P1569]
MTIAFQRTLEWLCSWRCDTDDVTRAHLLQASRSFPSALEAVHFDCHFTICSAAPSPPLADSNHAAHTELPTSIASKVYEGVISVVSYFAIEYTSNWNWHLEDLGSLIPTVSP